MSDLDDLLDDLDAAGLWAMRAAAAARLLDLARDPEAHDAGDGLGATEAETAPIAAPKPSQAAAGGGRWIEHKMINGCGPYRYERWFEGGRKRSRYLGKVTE